MQTPKKIAVAGATGRVGRHIVELLEADGHEVVAMSRATGVDVTTGEGLDEALAGVDTIIDAATGPSPDKDTATQFFTSSARNLQAAGRRAGVQRIVVVSIIGIEQFSGGYQAAKVAHEQAMLEGPIPVCILRAAQFHEFVGELMSWERQGDVAHMPKMRTQLVAARTVARVLADMATANGAAGDSPQISEVAGPREESLAEAAKLFAARRGDPVRIEAASDPSDPDAALLAGGALLPSAGAILEGPTFEQWLDAES